MATEKFSTETGVYQETRNSLTERIIDGWRDMRGSTRRLIGENPSEPRLLFYVLLSDMVFFLSWSIKTVIAPNSGAAAIIPLKIGLYLIVALMARTATMYVFSGVLGAALRLLGGTGSWKETRTGVFWGALVSAPFGLLAALLTVSMSVLEPTFPALRDPWIALPPYWIGIVPFVWFVSAGVAEAHGFRRVSLIFMCLSVLAVFAVFTGMYLRANGII
ncbi:MAG: YIP1 family protein [Paracoccaceae bacterium]